MKSITKATLSVIATGLLVLASASTASAADKLPPDTEPDRTIYIDHAAPSIIDDDPADRSLSSGDTEVRISEGTNFPVIPESGETVRVVYTDAIAEVARAGSCTKSLTTYTPYKSGNAARVGASWMVSTGCSSSDKVTIGLYDGWLMLASQQYSGSNDGYTASASVGKTCASSTNTSFRGISAWQSGGSVNGPSATLACRH